MKVTRDMLHEMIDKVNESEIHKIYDVLQSILNSNEIIITPREAALRKAKKNKSCFVRCIRFIF